MANSASESNSIAPPKGLPDPADSPGSDIVIYDGNCNFCISQVTHLRRLDCCGGRLSFLSLHDQRVAEAYPDLSYDQLMAEMYEVQPDGTRHAGGDAVRYLSRRLPLLWPAAPILHLPGSANLWRWLYQQVAKRRYKIAGKKSDQAPCSNGTCAVHFGEPPSDREKHSEMALSGSPTDD